MHKLIIFLGTGQGELNPKHKGSYKVADYYFEHAIDKVYTTPYVGEAIIKAKPNEFDEVYIIGTKDSMWETLYFSAIEENPTDEETDNIYEMIDAKNAGGLSEAHFNIIEGKLTVLYGLKVKTCQTPVGLNSEEHWEIFRLLTEIPSDGDNISLDITHSLRFQPFISQLAISYLQTLKGVNIKNVFYGALELRNTYFEGKTPIMNLNSLVSMLDWTNAAFALSRYGDTSVFNELLDNELQKEFLKRSKYFYTVLQLNMVASIKSNAERFLKSTEKIDVEKLNSKAFALIKDTITDLPKTILSKEKEWHVLFELAERHWKNSQYGLAILSAYESIIERLANIYKVDARNNIDIYKELGKIAKKKRGFGDIAVKMAKFRNAVAHAETEKATEPNHVLENFEHFFNELKSRIDSTELENLPKYYKVTQ
ncbi:MAG: hypothetical protein SCALA702_32480 [Melioribacteraceae bacterium]|nr:MAG: hypothetical protein SCALA702_32480 [Melioribacteraceae bacterium]